MTMANSTVASPIRSGASLRKTNKPLMEKRRRARINDSLSQLKSLVITGTKKDSSQFNKLEKADILELTVKHLRNLQNHQQQQQQQLAGAEAGVGPRYQDGFVECANEVIRYLGQAQGFSDDTKCRVINHLASCLQLANTKDKAMQASALAAQPAAAAMNTGTPTATVLSGGLITPPTGVPAQGQIIQIVSGPPPSAVVPVGKSQNVHILPSPPTATVLGSNNIAMTAQHSNQSGRPGISFSGQQQQQVAAAATSSHYSQPLHIHIPPAAFSPVLVKAENIPASDLRHSHKQQHQQQQQQQHQQQHQKHQHQSMDIDIAPRLTCPEQSPVRSTPYTQMSSKGQQQAAECSVVTTTPASTPS
ncbi:hypothetical protein EGW08_007215, partial [Elysia chlorotica]